MMGAWYEVVGGIKQGSSRRVGAGVGGRGVYFAYACAGVGTFGTLYLLASKLGPPTATFSLARTLPITSTSTSTTRRNRSTNPPKHPAPSKTDGCTPGDAIMSVDYLLHESPVGYAVCARAPRLCSTPGQLLMCDA